MLSKQVSNDTGRGDSQTSHFSTPAWKKLATFVLSPPTPYAGVTTTTTSTYPASTKPLQCFLCMEFGHRSIDWPHHTLYLQNYRDPYPDKTEADDDKYINNYPASEPSDDVDNSVKPMVMMMFVAPTLDDWHHENI